MLFAAKAALASLPNININAVIIILTVVFFGWRALYSVAVYIALEGLVSAATAICSGGSAIFTHGRCLSLCAWRSAATIPL